MLVKSLVALATEKMLLKTSGKTFLRGIDFMYVAGLAPERLSVMMTASGKYVLQFHSKCDIRPFAANYPSFTRVLRGIVHVRAWRIKSIEFVNVAFDMKDVDNLERTIDKLGVELVLLRNCTYPGVRRGDEAIRFLNALNRKKQAVVCEYGDDRLKHRISRRTTPQQQGNNRASLGAASPDNANVNLPPPTAGLPMPAMEHAQAIFARAFREAAMQGHMFRPERPHGHPYRLRRRDRNGHVLAPGAAADAEVVAEPSPPRPAAPPVEEILRNHGPHVAAGMSREMMIDLMNRIHANAVTRNNRRGGGRAAAPQQQPAQQPIAGHGAEVAPEPAAPMEVDDDDDADRPPRFQPINPEPIGDASDEEDINELP